MCAALEALYYWIGKPVKHTERTEQLVCAFKRGAMVYITAAKCCHERRVRKPDRAYMNATDQFVLSAASNMARLFFDVWCAFTDINGHLLEVGSDAEFDVEDDFSTIPNDFGEVWDDYKNGLSEFAPEEFVTALILHAMTVKADPTNIEIEQYNAIMRFAASAKQFPGACWLYNWLLVEASKLDKFPLYQQALNLAQECADMERTKLYKLRRDLESAKLKCDAALAAQADAEKRAAEVANASPTFKSLTATELAAKRTRNLLKKVWDLHENTGEYLERKVNTAITKTLSEISNEISGPFITLLAALDEGQADLEVTRKRMLRDERRNKRGNKRARDEGRDDDFIPDQAPGTCSSSSFGKSNDHAVKKRPRRKAAEESLLRNLVLAQQEAARDFDDEGKSDDDGLYW